MAKIIGYSRVSTQDQNFDLQIDDLKKEGVLEENIYKDKLSGSKKDRPGLNQCLKSLKAGDTLVVWKLDRLGRSLQDLIQIVQGLKKRGVNFRSITESIDTNSPGGNLIFHMFGALAEFGRDITIERTHAGLKAARSRGRVGGRPRLEPKDEKTRIAKQMYANGCSAKDIAVALGISRRTVFRRLA